ncbi:SPOSA6832_01283 [Sporobolomyces salmonicolor]|uniref:SPOSA6832_01283-mRNA-1:cds n=1 Tax=Sporidiobolus salmonicolor TaxID=5005 RepID=A0A0D6EIM3_SPOSA|nr:SPOSA6832_01283 [Sporobolomyces salmonicolor]
MDREQFRKAGYAAIDRICDYFENMESYDVVPKVQPGDVAKLIDAQAPEEGEAWDAIASDFDRVIMPGVLLRSPGKQGTVAHDFPVLASPIGSIPISTPTFQQTFNWLCSPACTELESVVMDWVAKLIGFKESWWNEGKVGGGVIMGSASESCLTVCIAARERFLRLHPSTPTSELVILGTTQTHSLGAKAALILGLEFVAIETRAEDAWALRGEALERELKRLEGEGKKPFILLATLGSTSTGAIDNIAEITAVTAHHPSLFLHIDAAWGGVFLSLPEAREEGFLEAINARAQEKNAAKELAGEAAICAGGEVHSFCTNLHKIRDRLLLTTALDVTPPFLRTAQASSGLVTDFRNWQIPLGRRFRSLKIWYTLRSFGASGFRSHLRKLISLGQTLSDLVVAEPGVELFTARRFSLVVFRITDASGELQKENELNAAFIRRANDEHRIMLTPTTVGGRNCVRMAIGSRETEERHLRESWEVIRALIAKAREDVAQAKA